MSVPYPRLPLSLSAFPGENGVTHSHRVCGGHHGAADSIHDCRDVLDDRILHRAIGLPETRPRRPHGSRPCAAVDHAASRLASAWGVRSAHTLSRGSLGIFTGLRSEEHTSELQSRFDLVCRLLLEKKI